MTDDDHIDTDNNNNNNNSNNNNNNNKIRFRRHGQGFEPSMTDIIVGDKPLWEPKMKTRLTAHGKSCHGCTCRISIRALHFFDPIQAFWKTAAGQDYPCAVHTDSHEARRDLRGLSRRLCQRLESPTRPLLSVEDEEGYDMIGQHWEKCYLFLEQASATPNGKEWSSIARRGKIDPVSLSRQLS